MQFSNTFTSLRTMFAVLILGAFVLSACTDNAVEPIAGSGELTTNDLPEGGIEKDGGHDHLAADTYDDFEELKQAEPDAYAIKTRYRRSKLIVMAIHGGGIEAGTSELASDIAGNDHDFYAFEGTKGCCNSTLHITSTKFDEPTALDMVDAADRCVSLHGFGSLTPKVYVGGRDTQLKNAIYNSLIAWGFPADKNPPSDYTGTNINNICNKTSNNAGVQLEISKGLRQSMFDDFGSASGRANSKNLEFLKFLIAVRSAL